MTRARQAAAVLASALAVVWGSHARAARPAGAAGRGSEPGAAAPGATVTVPFTLDHNRMIVDVEFVRPDGSMRPARAWVDTGNQFLMLGERLARELGVGIPAAKLEGTQYDIVRVPSTPALRLAGVPLRVEGVAAEVVVGAATMPGVPAEANLPASVLRRGRVVFDYPRRRMTFGPAGSVAPRGVPIPCRVNAETGLLQIAATLDGESVQLGVDNGSAGTWVSEALTGTWLTRHPEWAHAVGAVGSANFFGFGFEAQGVLMRLAEIGLGPLKARSVALLGLPQGLFDWYSKKTAGPVAGFLGANVLAGFRLEVDFPGQMTYWESGPAVGADDLDIVGVTLRPEADGSFTIAGVATRAGKPAVDGLRTGDRLIRVDGVEAGGATMGAVVSALRGRPGARRSLLVERSGRRESVAARVTRFP